ncbi:hypothetical protein DFH09DRAFT_1083332 [Mycena vulgaris]|nr:hypothetical protein DFH09DRAFT_1083332 [Mycena vulgaris]
MSSTPIIIGIHTVTSQPGSTATLCGGINGRISRVIWLSHSYNHVPDIFEAAADISPREIKAYRKFAFPAALGDPDHKPFFSVEDPTVWITSLGYQLFLLHDESEVFPSLWNAEDASARDLKAYRSYVPSVHEGAPEISSSLRLSQQLPTLPPPVSSPFPSDDVHDEQEDVARTVDDPEDPIAPQDINLEFDEKNILKGKRKRTQSTRAADATAAGPAKKTSRQRASYTIDHRRIQLRSTYLYAFLDTIKGFDYLAPEGFYDVIRAYGLPQSIIDLDRASQTDPHCWIRTYHGPTSPIVVSGVTKQGRPTSPLKAIYTTSLGHRYLNDIAASDTDSLVISTTNTLNADPHLPGDAMQVTVTMAEATDNSLGGLPPHSSM